MATRYKLFSEKDKGIANNNVVVIDALDVADNEYARFTASGLESRSASEVLSDIGAAAATHAGQHGIGGADSVFPADPGADKYLMWDDDPGQLVWADGGGGGGADTALSNLASVAINTSLISDTDSTDDLGSSLKYWANAYIDKLYLDADSSIVAEDIDNWNTAYGWGNHASAGYAKKTDNLSVFAATTSSQLAGVISDETGSGALVFGTSPTFSTKITTPAIEASSNDSGAIGASGTAFSDLFLASGGVIDFDAGDLTLTHSSNTLTLGGGSFVSRITPRVGTTASSSTPTPTGDDSDLYTITALAANATFAAPSGTPVNGQKLTIRIKDNGTARTLAWNSIYRAGDVALPTTTVVSKTMYLGFIYNGADSNWDFVAFVNNL